ncbi:hypothetical protein GOARA_036_00750 [Gordonia araii NBRC 100433]|uniref:Uncharacterized protein n=1 Tax=Gordonia araii NBRC 100433 TaxID=1073574 RepID=G7H0G8_9ACTN|nr:hypothetical protein GOARA_036_00750 [Gordonia araii NBRC 100433]
MAHALMVIAASAMTASDDIHFPVRETDVAAVTPDGPRNRRRVTAVTPITPFTVPGDRWECQLAARGYIR